MKRRLLLAATPFVATARAQTGLPTEQLGAYAGEVRFYRSIPPEDIVPPPVHPHVDEEDPTPFGVYFSISVASPRTAPT